MVERIWRSGCPTLPRSLRRVGILISVSVRRQLKSKSPPCLAKKRRERPTALNPWFLAIVKEGTGKNFKISDNDHWQKVTRPILEAFFHARYFLEMAVKYGAELSEPPSPFPSGWAGLLYLYNLR